VPYRYVRDESGFHIDLDYLESLITPRTRALIVNDLQNPLGAQCSAAERERLAELAMRHDLAVLLDEAYFDIRYGGKSVSLASIPGMAERSVILYTFSKKFAMTGWRLGAAIGPREIIDVVAKLNVNDESCSNHFVQHGALEGLTGDQSGPRAILAALKERRDTAVELLNSMPGVDCPCPEATFYLFPEVTELMERKGFGATTRPWPRTSWSRRASRSAPACILAAHCPTRSDASSAWPTPASMWRKSAQGFWR
jgi:aspartate/methionine/tyrosine aminotransferase